MKTFKWVIVGAGVAGCHLAIKLLHTGLAEISEIALVDPLPPLELWSKRTRNCGMSHLRSSCVHHIGIGSSALPQFEKHNRGFDYPWRGKLRCPSLELFSAHCEELLKTYQLMDCWQAGRVNSIRPQDQAYEVQTSNGTLTGESIALALGSQVRNQVPDWLEPAKTQIHFVLDPNFDPSSLAKGSRIAVVGAGMSAAQTALSLATEHSVTLLSRKLPKVSPFDFPSGWMAPVGESFLKKPPESRLQLIQKLRRPGTINPEVGGHYRRAKSKGLIGHQSLKAPSCEAFGKAFLLKDGELEWELEVDSIILATGFQACLNPLQQQIAEENAAPLLSDSYPLLDRNLQWLPKLYVLGCGAELQIGPAASNILGIRHAVSRIIASLRCS